MKKKVYRATIELANSLPVSKLIMNFSKSNLSKKMIPSYSKVFNINTNEMVGGINDYHSLHHFFTRQLVDGSRSVNKNEKSIVSPVDAKVEQFGAINNKDKIVVKEKEYSIEEMLGDQELFNRYKDGSFIVLYLSPSHYHRIHSPRNGVVKKQYSLGSTSYPVNRWGLTLGKFPLSKNYRTITEIKESDGNHIAVVKVGAMFINTIEITHNSSQLEKGEEMAYFSFGSTVVLLFEKDKIEFSDTIQLQREIKMGEVIAVKKF